MPTKKIKIQKLNDEELKELDLYIDFLLESISPITKQLVNPRFCLTIGKSRFTSGYQYKFGKGGKAYKTGNKLPPISSKEDIRNAILNSKHFRDFKNINIGLHSWNKNSKGQSLIFIDIDNKNVLANKAQLLKNNIKINSLTQTSASGGKHILVFVDSENELKNNYSMIPNVDLICRPQSYILAAGSKTEKGSYSLESTGEIVSVDFKSIPLLLTDAAAAIGLLDINSPEFILEKWLSVQTKKSCKGLPEGENPKHEEERVYKKLPQKLKDEFNKAFDSKTEIKQGQRMHFLRHIASKFLSSNTNVNQTKFLTFCCDINNEFFNPRLDFQEIKDFAFSYQKEFYSSIRKFNLTVGKDLKTAIDSIKQNLSSLPKEEDFKNFMKSEIVESEIQNLLEKLLDKKFKKDLPNGVSAKLLTESGFSKIQSRKKESRGFRFFNISSSSVALLFSSLLLVGEENNSSLLQHSCSIPPSALLSSSSSFIHHTTTTTQLCNVVCSIGGHAEHQASMDNKQLNPEQQTGIDSDKPECQSKPPQGSAEPATETKEQTLMNKQEPIETHLNNIQEQIIETLLEIQKATDITPAQRKQYFIEACEMINYTIWKELPKHIQNIILSDQIIKIIRRK